jgi:hypothetical protein
MFRAKMQRRKGAKVTILNFSLSSFNSATPDFGVAE